MESRTSAPTAARPRERRPAAAVPATTGHPHPGAQAAAGPGASTRCRRSPGPCTATSASGPDDHDLTQQFEGEPLGERIILHGRVLDGDGRPVPDTLVELWQANAAGRYRHVVDRHPAPLDPNFAGAGRARHRPRRAATGS